MPKLPYASVTLDVDAATRPLPAKPRSDDPFRILLMGDFSGRANRGEPPQARLRPYLIDRDNLDQVLARVRPELELGEHGRSIVLRFRELEDFHPDRIFGYPLFDKLREQRRAPSRSRQPAAPPPPPPPRPSTPDVAAFSSGSLLDDILDTAEPRAAAPARQPDALRAFISHAVAPHLEARADPRTADAVAEADTAAGKLMRAILHHRDFQALESGWRAVDWLVRGLETGTQLKVYLLDIGKADLAGSLHELHRLLVEQAVDTPGAELWSLVAANFTFARTPEDIRLLGEFTTIMRAAGAPLLAEADPTEADSAETAEKWSALRRSADAAWAGLALPRFLLRLPYGKDTDTVENFAFEEMPGTPVHQDYLWGNPAFACAYLIGQAFTDEGWDLRPGTCQQITGLPLHVYESDGDRRLTPCAEVLMTEHDAEWILEQGFMPLVSLKDQDAARLLRFQSIKEPLAPLSGRW